MQSRIAVWLLLVSVAVAGFCVWLDFHTYQKQSKTIPCEKNGLVFSITTFDGDAESEPFVTCLGHAWVSIDNRSGHSVYLRDYEIQNGEILTFSAWAVSGHPGVYFNLESRFAEAFGRYVGRQSLSVNIEESQLKTIERYLDRNGGWSPLKNCSRWSLELWNEVVEDEFDLKTQTLVYTPKRLQKSLSEFDCVEEDQDYTRARGAFFYQNGIRRELQLCS